MADIQCIFESVTGKGAIYISNLKAAQDPQLLKSMGIEAVLSVARNGHLPHRKDVVTRYLFIAAEDRPDFPLMDYFDQTYEFIQSARRQCNVLVHCMVGISRSATIIIAYLMRKYQYSLNEVLSMLQRKRKKINPNEGFITQLQTYAERLGIMENKAKIRGREWSQRKLCRKQSKITKQHNKQSDRFLQQNIKSHQNRDEVQCKDLKIITNSVHQSIPIYSPRKDRTPIEDRINKVRQKYKNQGQKSKISLKGRSSSLGMGLLSGCREKERQSMRKQKSKIIGEDNEQREHNTLKMQDFMAQYKNCQLILHTSTGMPSKLSPATSLSLTPSAFPGLLSFVSKQTATTANCSSNLQDELMLQKKQHLPLSKRKVNTRKSMDVQLEL